MQPETLGLLVDIRDAARFIAEETADAAYDGFLNDQRLRQSVFYSFTIIGEAVNRLRRLDQEIADRISAVQEIVGLRNTLIHGYQSVNYATVWRTIQVSLPVLQAEVEQLLSEAE